jgi:hypothetical protein
MNMCEKLIELVDGPGTASRILALVFLEGSPAPYSPETLQNKLHNICHDYQFIIKLSSNVHIVMPAVVIATSGWTLYVGENF